MRKKILIVIAIIFASFIVISYNASYVHANDAIGPWTATSNLPYDVASHVSQVTNNKISIIGGATSSDRDDVSSAEINTDGSLTPWQITTTPLPNTLFWHAIAKHNSNVYILGGAIHPPTTSVDTVYKGAVINGEIASWTSLIPLPKTLSLGQAVVSGKYLYYAGGFEEGSPRINNINLFKADINPDGTIGPWTLTTNLPFFLNGFGMIETGNKIVIIGGKNSDEVYQADILAKGELGPWILKDPLPRPVWRSAVTKIGNTVISAGGRDGSTFLDNVYYAEIDASGSIGSWSESSSSLPTPIFAASLSASDTRLYITGGVATNPGNYSNKVYYTSYIDAAVGLSVPDIKQYSSPWNDDEYDTASAWSENPTIERWGCALTSSSMVLQYHGHSTNPDDLNNWLNSQPDGYIRNGLLNWLAVSRYTQINSSPSSPTLEFRKHPASLSTLSDEIDNSRPSIVKVPGHFAVVKGIENSDYLVNDPISTNTLLSKVESDHGDFYSSIYSYIPSTTDLSYILLVFDSDKGIAIFDPNGDKLEGYYFLEEPLIDDMSTMLNAELCLRLVKERI